MTDHFDACLLTGLVVFGFLVVVLGELSLHWPMRNPKLREAIRHHDAMMEAARQVLEEERKKKEPKP